MRVCQQSILENIARSIAHSIAPRQCPSRALENVDRPRNAAPQNARGREQDESSPQKPSAARRILHPTRDAASQDAARPRSQRLLSPLRVPLAAQQVPRGLPRLGSPRTSADSRIGSHHWTKHGVRVMMENMRTSSSNAPRSSIVATIARNNCLSLCLSLCHNVGAKSSRLREVLPDDMDESCRVMG